MHCQLWCFVKDPVIPLSASHRKKGTMYKMMNKSTNIKPGSFWDAPLKQLVKVHYVAWWNNRGRHLFRLEKGTWNTSSSSFSEGRSDQENELCMLGVDMCVCACSLSSLPVWLRSSPDYAWIWLLISWPLNWSRGVTAGPRADARNWLAAPPQTCWQ